MPEKVFSFDYYRSWDDLQINSHELTDKELLNNSIDEIAVHVQAEKLHQVDVNQATIQLAKFPPEPKKSLLCIILSHAAPGFPAQLKLFLNSLLPSGQQVNKTTALESTLPFTAVDIWHQYKFAPFSLFTNDPDTVWETV